MIITVLLLPLASTLAVFLVYGRWSDIGIADVFWWDIRGYPWLRTSLALTLVTGLAGIAGAHRRFRGGILSSTLTYAGVVVPLVQFLFYPGPRALNRWSDDGAFYLLVLLMLIHGAGFARIRAAVERAESADNKP